MNKVAAIKAEVEKIYTDSSDEAMSKWFYQGHVAIVANYAEEIAAETEENKELATLAALFHDIARAWEIEKDPALMDESLAYAAKLMQEHDYSTEEIDQVKEAIMPHSCRDELPKTELGKILATADALAHLMTDFYFIMPFYGWLKAADDFEGYRQWLLEKIDRDLNKKIFYDEYQQKAKPRHDAIKLIFSKAN